MQREAWDAVVFNGYVNQYQHSPIRVDPGQRIRPWVLDVGPSENCAFHIVGTIFDTVYMQGAYLLRTEAEAGGTRALNLQTTPGDFAGFTCHGPHIYPSVTPTFTSP